MDDESQQRAKQRMKAFKAEKAQEKEKEAVAKEESRVLARKKNALQVFIKKEHIESVNKVQRDLFSGLESMCDWKLLQPVNKTILKNLEGMKKSFPNFSEVIDFLESQMTLMLAGKKIVHFKPLLLVGEPGVGKTAFLNKLSGILNVPFVQENAGALSSNFGLAGMDSSWNGAKPGSIASQLLTQEVGNFIYFLDELDKVIQSNGNGGDPMIAMYDLLEPNAASKFIDQCYGQAVAFNASCINFVAAANDVNKIHPAIVSRFRVFKIPNLTTDQVRMVAKSVHHNLQEEYALSIQFDELSAEVLNILESMSPRQMIQVFESAYAKAIQANRNNLMPDDLQWQQRYQEDEPRRIGFY
ncbi:AAA family ATPase [Hydrogenovibrio kuenenii]|uniref:AAA family ATPase n=1 Tax=Hydrogenovibrio kuenenii TaxID=63658 RepID=UPI000463DF02|nr:AAA family ATPase [Hydrogenovibrio kuenenii]